MIGVPREVRNNMLSAGQMTLLEQAVATFYGGSQAQIAAADRALDELRGHPQPWALLQQVVTAGCSTPTILWAVSLVEQWIKRRWRVLTIEERELCRRAVVGLVMSSAVAEREKLIVHKLQHLLASLLRVDWPHGWESFVPDLLGANLSDQHVVRILLLLAEESFVARPIKRAAAVHATLQTQGRPIAHLCVRELGASAEKFELDRLNNTLGLLGRIAPWLPPHVILTTDLLSILTQLLTKRAARVGVLKLLTELALPAPLMPEVAAHAVASEEASNKAAWLSLHATLKEVLVWAEGESAPRLERILLFSNFLRM